MRDFKGKVVLVTGGASGIGEATVHAMIAANAKVIVADRNSDAAHAVAQACGANARAAPGDVTNEADVRSWVEAAEKFGGLHAAVNSAGVDQVPESFEDSDIAAFEHVMRVNAFGVFLCMRFELQAMSKRKAGAIVNICSIAGLMGSPRMQAYIASKHAVSGLTKSAAIEYGDRGIRINAVCPGPTWTAMVEGYAKHVPGLRESVNTLSPQKRWAEPREMADVIVFLASDAASNVNGVLLPVDGGSLAGPM